jgi:hypothetical protein
LGTSGFGASGFGASGFGTSGFGTSGFGVSGFGTSALDASEFATAAAASGLNSTARARSLSACGTDAGIAATGRSRGASGVRICDGGALAEAGASTFADDEAGRVAGADETASEWEIGRPPPCVRSDGAGLGGGEDDADGLSSSSKSSPSNALFRVDIVASAAVSPALRRRRPPRRPRRRERISSRDVPSISAGSSVGCGSVVAVRSGVAGAGVPVLVEDGALAAADAAIGALGSLCGRVGG